LWQTQTANQSATAHYFIPPLPKCIYVFFGASVKGQGGRGGFACDTTNLSFWTILYEQARGPTFSFVAGEGTRGGGVFGCALIFLWLLSLYQDKESNRGFGENKI